MKFEILHSDPFHVLSSTKPIATNLSHIHFHENALEAISNVIAQKLTEGIDGANQHFGSTGNVRDDVQLIFLEDVVNFCFWAEKGHAKWTVSFGKEQESTGGWYSLTACFQKAFAHNIPLLQTSFLQELTLEKTRELFKGDNGVDIPLVEKRWENLQEAAQVLDKKYDGYFLNALETAGFDTIKLVHLLLEDFPSFRDISTDNGKDVYFLKRAQICGQDFSYIRNNGKKITMKHVEILTAFADYKIPQMLRHYGVISYDTELAKKVDTYTLIPQDSREEREIRVATIWGIELIKQKLQKYTAADIDNALWLISQDQTGIKPYHRTYTIYY